MLSFLRGKTPQRTPSAHQAKIAFESGQSVQEFNGNDHEWFVTHTLPPSTTPSFFAPPLHFHMYQTEYFLVRSGTGRFYLSGAQQLVPKDGTVTIPMRAYHRFENAEPDAPLVVDIKLDPRDYVQEVRFFRNVFGYLEDCRVQDIAPSVCQLLRFQHSADGPPAVAPGFLPHGVRNWLDWAVVLVGGLWIGEGLLGYKGTYPEYYKEAAQ